MPREKTPGHHPHHPPRRPILPPADVPATLFLRVILLASVGLLASIWALVHHYTHPLMPTHVPIAATATPWDAGAGLVEVDLENQ